MDTAMRTGALLLALLCVGCTSTTATKLTSESASPSAPAAASAEPVTPPPTTAAVTRPPSPTRRASPAPTRTLYPIPRLTPHASAGSGVEGSVQAGPTCPVERVDSPCPPQPVAADVTVSDSGGRVVARTRSGDDGRFRIGVAPGRYVVTAETGNTYPRCNPAEVTVPPDRYAGVVVECDTGIR
jgi:hypothetical protein